MLVIYSSIFKYFLKRNGTIKSYILPNSVSFVRNAGESPGQVGTCSIFVFGGVKLGDIGEMFIAMLDYGRVSSF